MDAILWLVTGAAVAWLACLRRATMCRQRLFVEAVFAALGALLGGLAAEVLAAPPLQDSGWPGLAGAVAGAVVLLSVANLRARHVKRGT